LQSNVTWCNGKTATDCAEMRGGGLETKKLTACTVHAGLTTLWSNKYCCGLKYVTFEFNISTQKHIQLTFSPFTLKSHYQLNWFISCKYPPTLLAHNFQFSLKTFLLSQPYSVPP
jgi:hypothetical protein